MEFTTLDIINITQMEMLGINKEYFYYFLLGIISVLVSVVIYFIIVKLIMKHYVFLNVYILSSLVALVLTINVSDLFINSISLQTVLQLIGIAGYILVCYLFVRYLMQKST